MSLITYDTFFPEILPSLLGCPEIVAFNAVRNTCIEFCTETWYWEHECFPQPGVPTIGEYDPDIPPNTKLLGIRGIWYDGRVLRPADIGKLKKIYWNQNVFDAVGDPIFFVQNDADQVRLVPVPNVPSVFQGIEMLVAVAPLRSSTSVIGNIYERYAETIAHGTKARLMGLPGQPFSNPQMAVMERRQYLYEQAQAKALVQRNKTAMTMKVRFNGRNA